MNKFETLIACRNHWQWMVITGSHRKQDYVPAQDWPFACVCCFYAGASFYLVDGTVCTDDRDCNDCPLLGYAWEPSDDKNDTPCDNNGIFSMWWDYKFNREIARKYAQQMVDACNRAIEDYLIKR